MKTIIHTITNQSIDRLWQAFCAGAAAFNADLPTALRDGGAVIPDDFAGALPAILVEIGNRAAWRTTDQNEVTPAGFAIDVDPRGMDITFGSGRSEISLRLCRSVANSRVVIGLKYTDDEMTDPASARASADWRHEEALRGLRGLPLRPHECSFVDSAGNDMTLTHDGPWSEAVANFHAKVGPQWPVTMNGTPGHFTADPAPRFVPSAS